MRALTPTMQAVLAGAHADAAWLLEIAWSDGATGRYADRAVSVDGTPYAAAIARLAPFEFADGGDARTVVELVADRGGSLWLELRGKETAGSTVRLGWHAVGTTAADVLWLVGGDLALVECESDARCRLIVQGPLAGLGVALPPHRVEAAAFPDAPPGAHGLALPLVYGDVPDVPAVPVRGSAATRLRGSITAASTSFEVEDAASPVAFPSGEILVRIDDEYVTGGFTGDTFAVTQRGAAAVESGTADGGAATNLIDGARTESDAAWVGFLLEMTGGTPENIGVQRVITAFDGATHTLSVDYGFPAAVAAGDTYRITTRAADHLHGAAVELVGTDHVFIVADHPCAGVADVRLGGERLDADAYRVNRNDTSTFPALGRAVTTLATRGRPRVKRFADGSRFLAAAFDADGGSSPGVAWANAIDPRPTFVAQLNAAQPTLALAQTTDMADGPARYGAIRRAFLVVQFRQDRLLTDDTVEIAWNGAPVGTLDPTQPEDHQGGGGVVDLVHTHPQDLSHPVAPVAREHKHGLPAELRVVQTDTVTGNAFNSLTPKTLKRSSTPPHAADEIIAQNLARFTITVTSSPSGFNQYGIFRLHYKLPYGSWRAVDSSQGTVTLNVVADITTQLNQWPNWTAANNAFQFWVENVLTSQIVVDAFNGVWEVTLAARDSQPSTTYLETETTDLPPVSLDGTLAPVQNALPMLSLVYDNTFDLGPLVGQDWRALNGAVASATYTVRGADDGVQVYIANMFVDVEFAPFAYVADGALTCRVAGVDAAGDGTGTALTNPADVLRDLLAVRMQLDPAKLDAGAFAQAAAACDALGARVDFALTEPEPAPAVLHRLAAEARGALHDGNGVVAFRVRPALDAPPSLVLSAAARADTDAPLARPGLAAVRTELTHLYARDYAAASASAFTRSASVADADAIGAFGRRAETVALRFVRDAAWAGALGQLALGESAWPGPQLDWPAHWRELALERGDLVWVTDAGLGLADVPGRVVRARHLPGAWRDRSFDRTAFGIRLAPWRLLRVFADDAWLAWAFDGLRYVIAGATVARVTFAGDWWIAGRFVRHAALGPGDPTNVEAYDAANRILSYSDSTGARLLELDAAGTLRAAGVEEINAPLGTLDAPEGTSAAADTVRWVRGGVAPDRTLLATLTADRWRLAGRIIQNRVFPVAT